jgi:hypothetical protein
MAKIIFQSERIKLRVRIFILGWPITFFESFDFARVIFLAREMPNFLPAVQL